MAVAGQKPAPIRSNTALDRGVTSLGSRIRKAVCTVRLRAGRLQHVGLDRLPPISWACRVQYRTYSSIQSHNFAFLRRRPAARGQSSRTSTEICRSTLSIAHLEEPPEEEATCSQIFKTVSSSVTRRTLHQTETVHGSDPFQVQQQLHRIPTCAPLFRRMASSDDHNAFHDDTNDSSIISVRMHSTPRSLRALDSFRRGKKNTIQKS